MLTEFTFHRPYGWLPAPHTRWQPSKMAPHPEPDRHGFWIVLVKDLEHVAELQKIWQEFYKREISIRIKFYTHLSDVDYPPRGLWVRNDNPQ